MNKLIFFVVFLTVGVTVTYYMIKPGEEMLPVINPIDLEEEMVDPSVLMDRIGYGHKIGNFSFKNQDGEIITQQETYCTGRHAIRRYKIWVEYTLIQIV